MNSAGPIVWASSIAITCGLLVVFQKVLFLVVPFLLALILFYILYPVTHRLVVAGMTREAAASVVTMLVLVLLLLAGLLMLPWITLHLIDWQMALERYLQGGMDLLQRSLAAVEARYGMLQQAQIGQRLDEFTSGFTEHYVAPVAIGIAVWTPSLLLTPFLAFFMLRDGHHFKRILARAVPNAFFEKTLYLLSEVDQAARAYFLGLILLTILDTATLALGLGLMGMPAPLALGLVAAVLAWVPYVGSILGGLLVVLVAATDFPSQPAMTAWVIALFVLVRLLDDFVYMPLTIGKSLHIHPVLAVLMIFIGGAVAGIAGLMLVLPVLGIALVVCQTIGAIVTDPRLMARYSHGRALRKAQAVVDL
jgi:predicted PurR-regulated permease PerM